MGRKSRRRGGMFEGIFGPSDSPEITQAKKELEDAKTHLNSVIGDPNISSDDKKKEFYKVAAAEAKVKQLVSQPTPVAAVNKSGTQGPTNQKPGFIGGYRRRKSRRKSKRKSRKSIRRKKRFV